MYHAIIRINSIGGIVKCRSVFYLPSSTIRYYCANLHYRKANLDLKIVNLLFMKSKETFKFYQNEIILIYVTNFI